MEDLHTAMNVGQLAANWAATVAPKTCAIIEAIHGVVVVHKCDTIDWWGTYNRGKTQESTDAVVDALLVHMETCNGGPGPFVEALWARRPE